MSNIEQPTSIPSSVVFTFYFADSDTSIQDITHQEIQQFPDYLSLTGDTVFFDALNSKLQFLHSIHRIQPNIGEIITYINDNQGRTYEVVLNHTRGVSI